MEKKLLFALDIGTRSVIGIVAEQNGKELNIIATERREHQTRAMLDGQIHDVPEVTIVINEVRKQLEKQVGPLTSAAVAAAGRALYTITASVEQEVSGILTVDSERSLEFAAIQLAQQQLATSNTVEDPTLYYCVGYSTIEFCLDGIQLKTLVGQRGSTATAKVIATFLPRQVIDSMQTALTNAKLDIAALTLEPIAAIQVLIPPTMRHLNLVLVDIGAGTSDIAVTRGGSIIAYGMVPCAGDEITEAISQKYLLDFNVAEKIKRQLTPLKKNRKISFNDILGMNHKASPTEIIEAISTSTAELAQAIAAQIIQLNGEPPQAVLLVGGGSLTPCLAEMVAEALDIPAARVAVRSPDHINDIPKIPDELLTPDSVTPLGILKVSSSPQLNFLTVTVNQRELRLFNFNTLTVGDALLSAGIQIKSLGGKPGIALTVNLNGKTKFIAGSMGTRAKLTLNGEPTVLDAPIANGDELEAIPGTDGLPPTVALKDLLSDLEPLSLTINDCDYSLNPILKINGHSAEPTQLLHENDVITSKYVSSVGAALSKCGFSPTPRKFRLTVNEENMTFSTLPSILLNDEDCVLSDSISSGDSITYIDAPLPTLGNIVDMDTTDVKMYVYFNKKQCFIPSSHYKFTINGKPAALSDQVADGDNIVYTLVKASQLLVSDALLAANYQPPGADRQVKFDVLVNGIPGEFTTPLKLGDNVEIVLTPLFNK